jgi:hypothetical protein
MGFLFRLVSWCKQPPPRRRTYRPVVLELEDRRLLAAPVTAPLDPTLPMKIAAGKTQFLPVAAVHQQGGSGPINGTHGSPLVKVSGKPALTTRGKSYATSGANSSPAGPTSAATTVSAKNKVFVQQAYLKMVGSPVPDALLNQLTTDLEKGKSRVFVAEQIEKSPEFRLARVRALYQRLLGSSATAQQVQDGLNFLKQGRSWGQLQVRILGSQMFFNLHGGTNAAFLAALGRLLLHQSLSASEVAKFSQELASGKSRASVVREVMHGHAQRLRQLEVQTVYTTYLGRLPTSGEAAAADLLLGRGDRGLLQLIAQLVGSLEFFNKLFAH